MSSSSTIRIASFDVGKKNFAQYIEDVSTEDLISISREYQNLPNNIKITKKNCPHDKRLLHLLDKVFLSGTRVQIGVYDLRDSSSNTLDHRTRLNILDHIDRFTEILSTVDVFIIEQQYFKTWGGRRKTNRGSEANVDAIKVAEVLMTCLLDRFPFRSISYFGSTNKTQLLGAPWTLSKTERKKWAEVKFREVCALRKDKDMIGLFELKDSILRKRLNTEMIISDFLKKYTSSHSSVDGEELCVKMLRYRQKLDDISDACIQLQAFKYKYFILRR